MTKKKTEDKNLGGQPTKMTEECIGVLESAFILGCTDREACKIAGIHIDTLYAYQQENSGYSYRKESLKDSPTIQARKIINNQLDIDNVDIAKWYLERKKKDEFSTRSENINTEKPYEETEEDEELEKQAARKKWGKEWGLVEKTN